MSNYKAETTLNERDSMQDVLNGLKQLMNIYSVSLMEGASKGFRQMTKDHLNEVSNDQLHTFLLMCEMGYGKVSSADEQTLNDLKEKFNHYRNEMS